MSPLFLKSTAPNAGSPLNRSFIDSTKMRVIATNEKAGYE